MKVSETPSAAELAKERKRLLKEREKLPIYAAKERLMAEIAANKAVVLVGETGSGKTTQVPQFVVEAGLGYVAVTQPRRVAAITLSQRVAAEMGVQVGDEVGYSVRFDERSSAQTVIKYLTDGMLLREAMLDPTLSRYSVVILDEAHERTVATDILFAVVRAAAAARPLRIIVMSATLEAELFVQYFGARLLVVEGRQHPVRLLYTEEPQPDYLDAALTTVLQIHVDEGPGDILVFLTGQDEIETLVKLLAERRPLLPAPLRVCPLFAGLAPAQQLAAFRRSRRRKVVIATNIAETSITLPGIRYVVDCGLVKVKWARGPADALLVLPVSQAQARQRAGRAGRDGPGVCYRLYPEAEYWRLPPAAVPELQRTNLAATLLQLKAIGFTDLANFPYLSPPPLAALQRALALLIALGALGPGGGLTELGRAMARLPLAPEFSRVIVASRGRCTDEALTITAMLSVDCLFQVPAHRRADVERVRRGQGGQHGDHIVYLELYRAWAQLPPGARKQWCADSFISAKAMQRAHDIREQVSNYVTQLGFEPSRAGLDYEAIKRAFIMGFFQHVAVLQPDKTYKALFSSLTVQSRPQVVLFNELIQTSRSFIRGVLPIEEDWLLELVPESFNRGPIN